MSFNIYPNTCPNCGAEIVYSYGSSLYLRCNRDYKCWSASNVPEEVIKHYDEYISDYDFDLIEKFNNMKD